MRTTQRITNVLSILALAIFISAEAIAQVGTWTTKAPMPTARAGSAAGVIGGLLYVNGGAAAGGGATTATEAYDPATNIWTAKAPSLVAASYSGAGVIDGKLYVVGGIGSDCRVGFTNILQMYDPATDTWTIKASMPTARSHMGGAVIGGKLYVVGGQSVARGSTFAALATLEAYDAATNTWATKAAMPAPRGNLGAGDVNGILYAVSGNLADGTAVKTVEAYNPATDSWTAVAPIPTGRYLPQPQGINGVLYVVGNGEGNTLIATLEAFTPTPVVLPPPPVLPTTTDQCRNGGWQTFRRVQEPGRLRELRRDEGQEPAREIIGVVNRGASREARLFLNDRW